MANSGWEGTCSLCGRKISERDGQKLYVDSGVVSMRLCEECLKERIPKNVAAALRSAGLECPFTLTTDSSAKHYYNLTVSLGKRTCTIVKIPASTLESEGDSYLRQIADDIARFLRAAGMDELMA